MSTPPLLERKLLRILALAYCVMTGSASAVTFAQTFFVPLTDADLKTSWQAIGTGATIGSNIKSVISIAVPKAGTLIYYDQWEDGYDADPSVAGSTTQIWGDGNTTNGTAPGYSTDIIPAGGVVVLNNTVVLPRVSTSLFFDGRDRINATNTVAVARVGWPTDPGPLIGTSAEAYETRKFGTAFQMPVGTASLAYQQFEYTSIHIMAAQDGTTVQVDTDGNGTVDQTQTLNMGQTMFVNGSVLVGATVTSNKPVQVHEVTGDIGSNYESRTFAVRPTAQWSSGYFAPVATTDTAAPHVIVLYNPGTRAITVSYEGLSTTGTITVPSKGNASFNMPQDSAVHFFTVTGEPFYAVGANDAGATNAGSNQNQDWGYALMPDTSLTTSIIAPFAPGADDTANPIGTPDANGSPVWVTPTKTTTVYVNYSGDRATGPNTAPDGSKYDIAYLVPRLASQKIFNPTTFDMSKSVIFTTDSTGLAGAWGEDPDTAGTALPYLDMGYAIIPFAAPIFSKFAALSTDANANGVIDVGDTVLFTLFLNNDGVTNLVTPVFTDPLPAGITYVPNSTVLNGAPVADDATGTPYPLDGTGITPPDLVPGASATVKFRITINSGTKSVTNTASANSTSVSAPMYASVNFPISPVMITGNVYNDANGLTDGIVNGTGTNISNALYANIVSGGVVVQVYRVDADGTYRFINIPGNTNYTIVLSTTRGTVDAAAPAAALPAGYVNTGENLGLGVANDGNPDGTLALTLATTNVANANFGVEQTPTANATSTASQANPGGTTRVAAPTLSGTDPEDASITTFIINTLPANGTLYYNGVAVTAGQTIPSYTASLLRLDPDDGAITATFTYSAVDAAGKSSAPATATMPFTTVSVSGTVYDDANGLQGSPTNTVDGTGSNAGGTLYMNLVTGGNVAQVVEVAADGTFIFATVPAASYTLVLSTTQGTVGSAAPAAALPAGYVNTAEKQGTGTGSDGTVDGSLAITVGTSSVTNNRFGFNRTPTANNVTAASQTTPTGTTRVTVPTLSGTDPEDGALTTTMVINTLATGGTLYYNGTATTVGQVITSYNPSLLTIDPAGTTSVSLVASFTYSVRDAAGLLSPAATVTMPFTGSGISIFGNVYDDANGLTDSTVNGTGTNAGGLFAILTAGGSVTQSVAVSAAGAYVFPGVVASTNYTITLSTTAGTVGGAPPAVSLPSGWVSTGEFLGTAAGNDGTVNGSLAVTTGASGNINNANFGIDRTPTATSRTATMANPGGITQVPVPALLGTDPEDGTLSKFVINTLPGNGTLYYNGVAVTLGQTITGFDSTLLTLDPNDGAITVSFTYSTVDAANRSSAAVSCAITFTSIGISGTVFDDANGLTDSIVNGTGTNASGTLYANLVSNGTVAQVATVAANGTYSFGTVAQNSTYTVVLSTTQGTVGTAAPSASLPSAFVNTGENIGTAAGNDGTVNGSLVVATVTTSITNANFGIDALPTASNVTAASQINPAGTNQVTVPTLAGTDPEDSTVTKFTILSLPTNGTLYYNSAAVTVNQTITGYTASLLKFDPVDGSLTATFSYASVDAAGKSSAAATVTMPFTSVGISGTVFDDANGLTDSIVNGTGTNASNTLYAHLVSGGNVLQVQDVGLAGTYNFLSVAPSTTYTVVISTTRGTVGSAAPAAGVPSGWVNTGEFIGTTAGNDGTTDGVLTVAVTTTAITNANFGIEQPPSSSDVSAASQLNPAGTARVVVPTLVGSDPEDTSITSFKIVTLPSNGTLYYNGTAVTLGQTIASYNASLLMLDPNDGTLTTTFTYSAVDAAGRTSTASTVTMPFTNMGLSGNVYNDANGLLGTPANTVDGTAYAGATTLYANLVSGTTVAQVATVASGAYSFGTVAPNTSYAVVLSTTQGVVGNTAPPAAPPSGYVNTGENLGSGTGSDGTVNGILAVSTITSSITNANFGIERTPTANNVSSSSQVNPAGTTQVTVPTLTGADPEDATVTSFNIVTLPSNGTLYYNGVAVTLGQTISSYNATLLKLDPNDGAITVTFTYSSVDLAGKFSPAATATMPFTTIGVSGTVFNDANGLVDSIVNGTGTNAGGTLYANLVAGGNVSQVQAVQANGTYNFVSVVGSTSYTVVLSTTQGTVGSAAPAAALPSGWVNTGEFIGTAAGNDGTVNGSLPVAVTTTSVANANFGIERPPTATNVSSASQLNPGGTAQVTVPTLTGTDPEDASVTKFTIATLPANGTLYYNGVAVTLGQTITAYDSSLMKLDPNDGAITATFTYTAVDAANRASAAATVTMPFTNIGISGNVYNDANGLLGTPVNTVDGTAYAGTTLYANLVSGTTVAQAATVTAGAYSFGTVSPNTSYTVVLSTTQGTVGNTAPAASLPSGWVNTGENIGSGTGSDGSPNGVLAATTVSSSITNANFGVERTPTATNVSSASQLNPAGTAQVTVPTLTGTDPEDASVASFTIVTLPSNGTLYYNGVAVTLGQTISSYSASLLKVDPNDGAITVSFTYSAVDAAGKSSAAATATMPFTAIGISGNVYNDANGLLGTPVNTVDGTTYSGATLYANLVSGGNVAKVATVTAGAYSFGTVAANTSYTVVLSTTQGTVGNAAPAASLPAGYVNTGENVGSGTGSDGSPNGSLAVTVVTTSITNANFGVERTPTANNVSSASQVNPAGTVQVTVPTLTGSDPEDSSITSFTINTLPANGTLYYNNVAVTLGQTISSYNASLLKLDPNDGAITVTFTYSAVDAAGKPSASPATVTMPFTAVGISGNVYNDANGLLGTPVNTVDGTAYAGATLYANLVTGGNVSQVTTVTAGAYSFSTVATNTSYTVVISTTQGVVGNAAPAAALPVGYVNTGENIGAGAGSDGSPNGSLAVAVVTTSLTNANFGVDQLPTANNVSSSSQSNPAGTAQVTVPTLNGTDPEDGTVTTFTINTLPSNGTLYYNNVAVTVGQTISNYNSSLLKLDPNDGAIIVSFTYSAVDAAGKSSAATATVTMPFTAISISGNVFNDANGLLGTPVNTVDGTAYAGATLYANLVSGGNVVQVATVTSGAYSFGTVAANTSYTVVLSTTQGVVGNAAPAAALPSGWVNTGENVGAGAGNDGSVDGSLAVTVVTSSITNANFGVERTPTANNVSLGSQLNPAGTAQVTAPTLTGSDPEDSSITSFTINTLPANGTLYYNGGAVTLGQTISSYNSTLLKVDPNDGAVTVSFTYSVVDAAGKSSATATATMPFTAIGISGNVYNDANGLLGTPLNTVDGTAYAGATLYANLVSGGNVAQVATVTTGAYSFGTVAANTSYTVVLSPTQGTVGNAAPAAALPAGYVNTGENVGAGTGSDGSPNGSLAVTVVTSSITNANFGVERTPAANNVSSASQLNPAGTAQVTVPTLAATDPEDASVTSFTIVTLPSNGTLYYNGVAVTLGQTISSYSASLLKVDPNDGAITVSFTYSAVDAAGKSSAPATATMPFTAVGISGNVYNDANGLLGTPLNTVDGTAYAGATLYANLVSGGNVVQVATVTSGAYSFGTVASNTSYTVVIGTTQGVVGNAAPAAALPAGWVNTGENVGAGTGSDGSPNGSLAVTVATSSITNANFGVERTPTANNVSSASRINPAGTVEVTVPILTGTDTEDSSITSFTINTLPSNGTLYYNGVAVTLGQTIGSYSASLLRVDPNDGAITVSFTYSAVDAAGKSSVPATVTMPFTAVGISGHVYNDENGLLGTPLNTVDGTTYTGATLYANLVIGGDVVQVATVVSGAYSFGTVAPNTSYSVVISTTQGTVGSPVPAAVLPSSYVHTGENIGAGAGSDGNPNGLISVIVTTTSVSNVNFGVRAQGDVAGHLYIDTNGNGQQDSGEPDLENVDVVVTDAFGGTQTVTTDSDGNWTASVPPGETTVNVDESDPEYPTGSTQTEGTDLTTVTALAGGVTSGGVNGYFFPGSISGFVLADTDNDDIGDAPLQGVLLTLVNSSGSPILAAGNPVTATTGVNGGYSFGDLPPGTYGVVETQPSGYNSVSDKDGGNLNEIRPIIVTAGNSNTGNTFIEEQPGSISGTVSRDTDNDGDADAPLAGVTLRLLDSSGQPVLDGSNQPITTLSAANGTYTFSNVSPGSYRVAQVQPVNYNSVSDSDGANNNVIGDETPIIVTAGNDNGGNNFIEVELGVISGYVLLDTDNNGSGDASLPGVVLNLLNASGSPVLDGSGDPIRVASGVGGYYSFTLVPPGAYQVSQSQPSGYGSVSDVDGANNNVIGDQTPIVVTPGLVVENKNFVEIQLGSLSGYVYVNASPLAGVTLTLLDGSGNPIDGNPNLPGVQYVTTVTDSTGFYRFTGLMPGTYRVAQTQPFGYESSSDSDGGDLNIIGDVSVITVLPGQENGDNDFIEIPDTCPDTWAEWKFQHPGEQAAGNPDADDYDNLNEFAFAMSPDSGAGNAWALQPSTDVPGTLEGIFVRPKGAVQNVVYTLQYTATPGNPMVWQSLVITPAMITTWDNGDCTETVIIRGMETLTGLTGGSGFARIKVDLDEENDNQTDHTSYTEVEGWKDTGLELCCRTYSNPFLRETDFTGTVTGVSGQTLDLSGSAGSQDLGALLFSGAYYVEVTSGDNEGHRFDVVSASGSTLTLANDSNLFENAAPFNTRIGALPANLAGDTIVMRRHWTLGEMFPAEGFGGNNDPATADQVQLFTDGQWTIYWLYDDGVLPKRWVRTGDNTFADQGAAIMAPGQGLFFNNRTTVSSLLAYGEVRSNDFIRPVAAGSNLISSGYPVDQSAASRAMTVPAGFFGSRDIATADTFYVWKADTTIGATGYDSYFLNNNAPRVPSVIKWLKIGDATQLSRDSETLLLGNRSVFLRSKNGIGAYRMPAPWSP